MKNSNTKQSFLLNVIREKCPNCNKGYVFKQNVSLLKLPVMNDVCENCNYHYDREPGYFLGAMYISYGLAALQGILTFFVLHYSFPFISTIWKALLVISVIILLGRKNYKLSRVLYIHIFPW
jgi:uncharacterized protein (DUF983 family)